MRLTTQRVLACCARAMSASATCGLTVMESLTRRKSLMRPLGSKDARRVPPPPHLRGREAPRQWSQQAETAPSALAPTRWRYLSSGLSSKNFHEFSALTGMICCVSTLAGKFSSRWLSRPKASRTAFLKCRIVPSKQEDAEHGLRSVEFRVSRWSVDLSKSGRPVAFLRHAGQMWITDLQ